MNGDGDSGDAVRDGANSGISAEEKAKLLLFAMDRGVTLMALLMRLTAIVASLWILADMAKEFAGEETTMSFIAKFLGNVTVSKFAFYAFAISGWAFGYKANSARKAVIKRYSPYIEQNERLVDPNRKGSNLTPIGTTNPEDRI